MSNELPLFEFLPFKNDEGDQVHQQVHLVQGLASGDELKTHLHVTTHSGMQLRALLIAKRVRDGLLNELFA